MVTIQTRIESRRGCGWRKPGGLYLMGGDGPASFCCKLPFPLSVCNCCGGGIKPTRGFTWINSTLFVGECEHNHGCPISTAGVRMGLLWVGGLYYDSTDEFNREANALGISRRIAQLPRGLDRGMWIALAHRKAIIEIDPQDTKPIHRPGVFRVFKLQDIQYVVDPNDPQDKLIDLERRGVSLVKIERAGDQLSINQFNQ